MAAAALELKGDVLSESFLIQLDSREFELKRQGETLYVFEKGSQAPLGTVRPAGSFGGSIWIGADCVGEYYLVRGEYQVTPIRDGFKQAAQKTATHPVLFLLREALRS